MDARILGSFSGFPGSTVTAKFACAREGNSLKSRPFPAKAGTFRTSGNTVYAVIKSGGKQYKVAEGDTLTVERLALEPGGSYDFSEVLMLVDGEHVQIGAPFLDGARVSAKVVEHGRGKKLRIIKFKRRKHHLKRMGHRQGFTKVEITKIAAG